MAATDEAATATAATLAATKAATKGHPLLDIFQGALASCMAVTLSNPLEVVKIRLQLQGELIRRGEFVKAYRSVPHGFYVISKTEGLRAIQKGLLTAYWYQVFMNGTRLGLYDTMMRTLDRHWLPNPKSHPAANVVCGALAGVIGAAVGSPFYLIKTRLQSAGGAVGHQYTYKGMVDGLQQIYQTTGVRGLWRGANAAMLRTMVGSATQLTTYSSAKELVVSSGLVPQERRFIVEAASAMVCGVVVAFVMNPFDVISTRMYNQNPNAPLYNGTFDAVVKILRTEGPLGMFKGVGAHYLRIGPHTFFTLLFWEQIKRFLHSQ